MSPGSSRNRKSYELLNSREVTDLWQSRFGLPEEAFSGLKFYRRAKSIWALSGEELPNLSYEALGMRIMSLKDRPWKPTTCALQVFGKYATKNIVELDQEQARVFMAGESQQLVCDCEPGYVVVFYRGDVLGCGLYSHNKLTSQLPKERRIVGDEDEEHASDTRPFGDQDGR